MTRSSGNVFLDLGFPPEQAEHLVVRSDLMIHIQKEIASRGLKRAQGAKALQVSPSLYTHLLRGRLDLFTTDTLIDMLARLGVHVRLVLKTSRRRLKVA